MDWLTFSSEVIRAIAWPAAVVAVVLVLKRPLSELTPLLEQVRYKELQFNFARRVEDLTVKAVKALPAPTTTQEISERASELQMLAGESPRSAILEAWTKVETEIVAAAKRKGLASGWPPRVWMLALQQLSAGDYVTEDVLGVLATLKSLRNYASRSHDKAIAEEDALSYIALANSAIDLLGAIGADA